MSLPHNIDFILESEVTLCGQMEGFRAKVLGVNPTWYIKYYSALKIYFQMSLYFWDFDLSTPLLREDFKYYKKLVWSKNMIQNQSSFMNNLQFLGIGTALDETPVTS